MRVEEALVPIYHQQIELSLRGGHFPLGGNNTWHGGVHLNVTRNTTLVAPFDGTIVAARLDPDPDAAMGAFGHTNFILLRHEIGEDAFKRLQFGSKPPDTPSDDPKTPSKPKSTKPTIGRGGSNEPDLVVQVKHALHDAEGGPFYAPEDPAALDDATVDEEFLAAIDRFQSEVVGYPYKKKGKLWPDGVITQGYKTWTTLFDSVPTKPDDPAKGGGDPAQPADVPPDPRRTIYSLLMHVDALPFDKATAERFPWLKEVALTPTPEEKKAVDTDSAARHDGDEAERKRGIKKQVGYDPAGPEVESDAEDVKWVQKRLQRFGYFRDGQDAGAAIDGVYSDELREAIRAFQRDHVDYYDPGASTPNPAPGFLTVKGDTHKRLKDSYAKLFGKKKPAVDPVLAHRAATRKGGVATVLTDLGVRVGSGEPLWASGLAEGSDGADGEMLHPQVHWELFSSDPLVDPWERIEDLDDDLTLDMREEIFARIEFHELPGFTKDKVLTPFEIREFYSHPRSSFFRSTQCRFRSEWGLDVGKTVARMSAQGFETDGLADELAPYMWWDEAKSVLPASPHVWHYNPIELLWRYEQVLASMRPGEPTVVTYGSVEVTVMHPGGAPVANALVHLAHGADVIGSMWTDLEGRALFGSVPTGAGAAWVDGTGSEALFELGEGELSQVEITVDVPAPAVTTGTLNVFVVGDDWLPIEGAIVALRRTTAQLAPGATNADGVAVFVLAQGYYEVATEGAPAEQVAIVAGSEHEITLRIDAVGAVEVAVVDGHDAPVVGEEVGLEEVGGSLVARAHTDDAGCVRFDGIPEGSYVAYSLRDATITAEVEVAVKTTAVARLVLPLPDTPTPSIVTGAIEVLAVGPDGMPVAGQSVALLDDGHLQIDERSTDESGRASFEELDPGTYGVTAEGAQSDELGLLVEGGVRKSVQLRMRAAVEPAAATGRIVVTAMFQETGTPAIGLWAKVASNGTLVGAQVLGADGSTVFEEVPCSRCRVFVDGFEESGVEIDLPPDFSMPVLLLLPAP